MMGKEEGMLQTAQSASLLTPHSLSPATTKDSGPEMLRWEKNLATLPHGRAELLDGVRVALGGLGKDSESLSLEILHPCTVYSFV